MKIHTERHNLIIMLSFIIFTCINLFGLGMINSFYYANIVSDLYYIIIIGVSLITLIISLKPKYGVSWNIKKSILLSIMLWFFFYIYGPEFTYNDSLKLVQEQNIGLIIVDKSSVSDPHYNEIGFRTQPATKPYNFLLDKDYVIYGYTKKEDILYHFIVNPTTGEIIKVKRPTK